MATSVLLKGLLARNTVKFTIRRQFHNTPVCAKSVARKVDLYSSLPKDTISKQRRSAYLLDRPQEPPVAHVAPRDFKYVHPEFLPDPNWQRRDKIREMIERKDMVRRRQTLNIPEFYIGSILSVTVSDPYAPQKSNRFVGLCIDRAGHGLRTWMLLRNVIDGQGVEILYEIYNPLIQKIEVLKLEKRLDEKLYYLRDSPPEYSTVPFDMEKIVHPPGAPIPVNMLKVKLNPRPWHERWERQNLHGIQPLDLPERFWTRAAHEQNAKPYLKQDLMRKYRESINEDEASDIYDEVYSQIQSEKLKDTKKGKQRIKV